MKEEIMTHKFGPFTRDELESKNMVTYKTIPVRQTDPDNLEFAEVYSYLQRETHSAVPGYALLRTVDDTFFLVSTGDK